MYQECENNDECPTLFSENQTLLILKASVGYDNGSYICVAHNSSTGQNISHLEDVLVVGIEFIPSISFEFEKKCLTCHVMTCDMERGQ